MNNYGISFIRDECTIMVEADWFDIKDGFIQFFKAVSNKPFAAYNLNNIYYVVLQKKYTEQEVLDEINKLRNDECQK